MPGDCGNMFDVHCKDAFDTAKDERKAIRESLDSLSNRILKTNGKRSVVDCIADNKHALLRHIEDGAKTPPCKTIWGGRIRVEPIESRDIWRILGALSVFIIALKHVGLLDPIIAWITK